VIEVPAEYVGPNSGNSDHPQHYHLNQFSTGSVQGAFTTSYTWRILRNNFFSDPFFLDRENFIFYRDWFISPDRSPWGWNSTLPRGGPGFLRCNALFQGGVALVAFLRPPYLVTTELLQHFFVMSFICVTMSYGVSQYHMFVWWWCSFVSHDDSTQTLIYLSNTFLMSRDIIFMYVSRWYCMCHNVWRSLGLGREEEEDVGQKGQSFVNWLIPNWLIVNRVRDNKWPWRCETPSGYLRHNTDFFHWGLALSRRN